MDHGMPEEIMEGEWTEEFDNGKDSSLLSIEQFDMGEEEMGDEDERVYPNVGECLYVQWIEEEESDEAPGWYFGKVENIADGLHTIVYSDQATESIDLTKVNFVIAKQGSRFYSSTRPKPYKGKTKRASQSKAPRVARKSAPPPPSPRQQQTTARIVEEEEDEDEDLDDVPVAQRAAHSAGHHRQPQGIVQKVLREMDREEQQMGHIEEEEHEVEEEQQQHAPLSTSPKPQQQQPPPQRFVENGNIVISQNIRHPTSQIILVQRGPNGELEEIPTQPQEVVPPAPAEPVATIIEEEVAPEPEPEPAQQPDQDSQPPEQDQATIEEENYASDGEDSATEIMYPDEEHMEDEQDLPSSSKIKRVQYQDQEIVVDRNGKEIVRGMMNRVGNEQYMPTHTSEQVGEVERYNGCIISTEQMMMGSRQRGDVENYQVTYQENDDLERLQGRLITEEAMNMLDDKGEGDDDDYSGDEADDQDPRMPRRRGKYVRKTPEELDQVPRPWQCEFCPRAFPNKYHLQIHLRTHTGEKPYRCTECDMAFSHSSNLCSHIRTHNGIKPYKCKHCGKEFGRSNNMKAHTRIHTGEKPFECRFCGKAFRFGNHLTIHERSHTGERPYKCTYCDRAFRNSSNLRTHERLHTDERPYRCKYCDRAFSGSGNLHAHERVHTGERPFQCDVCSKAFSQSSTLRIHQRIHTGDKRYQCSLCGRRFIQSNHLKTHLRRMHHIDDSVPTMRSIHPKTDPYGMQPLNPNHFRVVTKQEPDDMDHYERASGADLSKPSMLKSSKAYDSIRPGPLVVDDDVRSKEWGAPLGLHGNENHRHN